MQLFRNSLVSKTGGKKKEKTFPKFGKLLKF